MKKKAYATFARNANEVEDALILLKSIKETKTFQKLLILHDSEIEISLWYVNMYIFVNYVFIWYPHS